MPLEVRWLIQPAVTACYAAGLAFGQAPGNALAAALSAPVAALRAACRTREIDVRTLADHLMFQAADNVSPSEMTRLALTKTVGPAGMQHADALTPLVAALLQTLVSNQPKLADELELRCGPLREQWEARGPGLMKQLGRLTEPGLIADQAAVLGVYPLEGGGGRALIAYNVVAIEAVLANPHPELPEIVRLGWLLAMLNCDLARYREALLDAPRLVPLAMIPPVLAAAAEVELVRLGPGSIELALSHWRPREADRPDTAEVLAAWWQTYRETRPPWSVALAGLKTMLS